MNKKNLVNVPAGGGGVILNKEKTAYTFTPEHLAASDHFFRSNTFQVKTDGGEIHFLFGQRSLFDNGTNLKAAVEISMPVNMARIFLSELIYDRPSLNGKETFYSVLESYVTKHPVDTAPYQFELKLPSESNLYRAFSANYSTVAISQGQSMIEFFEANPSFIANMIHGKSVRDRDGLKPVIAIIMPPQMMKCFFDITKTHLDSVNINERDSYELAP